MWTSPYFRYVGVSCISTRPTAYASPVARTRTAGVMLLSGPKEGGSRLGHVHSLTNLFARIGTVATSVTSAAGAASDNEDDEDNEDKDEDKDEDDGPIEDVGRDRECLLLSIQLYTLVWRLRGSAQDASVSNCWRLPKATGSTRRAGATTCEMLMHEVHANRTSTPSDFTC